MSDVIDQLEIQSLKTHDPIELFKIIVSLIHHCRSSEATIGFRDIEIKKLKERNMKQMEMLELLGD